MNKKNIITIIILVIVVFIAFQYLGSSNTPSSSDLSADTSTSNSSDAQQIYSLLQEMQQVKLSDTLFANSIFQNLKDNTVVFAPQQAGRNNPFSPVGSDLLSGSGQTSATTTK